MARKIPKIITQEEFERILKSCNDKKLRLAILLGFEAGLRISEIVGYKDRVPRLNKENIDLTRHVIIIRSGKGNKDRIVPLPKRFNQNAYNLLPITIPRRTIQYQFKQLAKKILGKDISFHTLRHGFGSHLAGKGRPLHEIQMLMGHESLVTTGIYLHANPEKAIEKARDVF